MEETLFNKDKALEQAMNTFWNKGYENTSLKDLLNSMKILNGSFYNSFKSKEALFIKSVDLYAELILMHRISVFQKQPNFKSGLKAFFNLMLNDLENKKNPKGCMIISSVESNLFKNEKIKKAIKAKLDIYKNFLKGEILKAQEAKELPKSLDPQILSSLILTFTQGISKSSIAGESTLNLNAQIDTFLNLVLG